MVVQKEQLIAAAIEFNPESSSHTAAADLPEDPATVTILAAIKASKSSLISRIDTLLLEYGLLRQNLDKFWGCLTIAEYLQWRIPLLLIPRP